MCSCWGRESRQKVLGVKGTAWFLQCLGPSMVSVIASPARVAPPGLLPFPSWLVWSCEHGYLRRAGSPFSRTRRLGLCGLAGRRLGNPSSTKPGLDAREPTPREGQAKSSGTAGHSRLTSRHRMDRVESQTWSWKGSSKPPDFSLPHFSADGRPKPSGRDTGSLKSPGS